MGCLVWVVGILVGLVLLSAWGSIVIPWQWWASPVGIVNLIATHTLLGLMVYSYRATIITCPGRVPHGWIPAGASAEALQKAIDDEEEYRRVKRRRGGRGRVRVYEKGAPRYCSKCQEFKPPRSHHCSECRMCTLKMDHHCPWVDNCVGQGNHKTFILFLVYAIVGMTYAGVLFVIRLVDIVQLFAAITKTKNAAPDPLSMEPPLPGETDMRWPALHMAVCALSLIVVVPLVLSLLCLLGYQLGILAENVTTIEDYERELLKKKARRDGKPFTWQYDTGSCMDNYRQVMGQEVKRWLLPWPSPNDGNPSELDSKDTV
jgi:hypothetical protein